MSLRIRRGTNSERLGVSPTPGITFAQGEIVWVTDTKKVYIGDGATVGGKNILETSAGTGLQFDTIADQLKINDTYMTNSVRTTTSALFSAGTHTGISFAYGPNSISATVNFTEAQAETIRQEVINMFDQIDDDINFIYQPNTGNLVATLRPERVRFYALDVFTGGNHTGISFQADNIFNNVSATVNSNWVKDLVGTMFPQVEGSNVAFNYNTTSKSITASVTGVLTTLSQDLTPVLGGNLDLNGFSVVGNGTVSINGTVRLNPLATAPTAVVGSMASANQLGWDPVQGVTSDDDSYLMWYNGSNWIPLSGYQNNNIFFVDPLRTHLYNATGSLITPFKTISDAISAASDAGYDVDNPAYIILMSNITEDVVLTQGGIYLTGIVSTEVSSCVKLSGTIIINANDTEIEANQFAIANLNISASTNFIAIDFTGENPQTCSIKNSQIKGSTGSRLVVQSNLDANSTLSIIDSKIISNHTDTIVVDAGSLELHRCTVINSLNNSNGVNLSNEAQVTVIDTTMNISTGTGRAVIGTDDTSFKYHNISFIPLSNTVVSSYIGTISNYVSSFTMSRTYNINSNVLLVSQGGQVVFTITTTDVNAGTVLYWNVESVDVNADAFVENNAAGSVTIDNAGTATITRTMVADVSTLDSATFKINLRTGTAFGPIVASSPNIVIVV